MSKEDLNFNFKRIDVLINEINFKLPADENYGSVQLRADLAGLLVVAMAATYETCVKEVICNHATSYHNAFGEFAARNYEKLNSRVRVSDLTKYCELFGGAVKQKFKDRLQVRRRMISRATGRNIETSFEQILNWRHDFAHAWNRNTTIEEAAVTHRFAKHVLYVFDDAFEHVPLAAN